MSCMSLAYPCAALQPAASSVQQAFARGVRPILLDDGTGGVYACRSLHQRFVGIFKPCDEEPGAPFNPKEHGNVVRRGVPLGQMAVRECMAFLVDIDGFARVPATALAFSKHEVYNSGAKKLGSFQAYCPHDCSAEDMGPASFSVDQVHAIACLDIRLFNQDRHSGNLLVQHTSGNQTSPLQHPWNLIPIDHGCCLPELEYMDETTFAWMHWPQAKVPFDTKTKAYVGSLDSFAQEKTMKQSIRPPVKALATLHVGTLLLKKCVAMGLTAYDMAQLLVRSSPSVPSPVECLVAQLKHLDPYSHIQLYLRVFEVALDKLVRRMFPRSSNKPAACTDNVWMAQEQSQQTYVARKTYAKVLLSSAA
ncbi:hypothetical protein H310_11717 [Aphanomyces invadans]|uniref:PI3K/PI4K catalytic domain-containing protein n=1 Tax=Aphanomyces invadans TaxID=157072 RepID=A0A024TMA4_9STRA|nr:hypothetical protein H310_11717 [Aphanomyces invadans]ETV94756.1 hypothetical protein H310_11717 [Aphanomyces invadans]|eukprot:XP_008876701.1 hypothetical protein H310_11717 [Aphanomyces invadans]